MLRWRVKFLGRWQSIIIVHWTWGFTRLASTERHFDWRASMLRYILFLWSIASAIQCMCAPVWPSSSCSAVLIILILGATLTVLNSTRSGMIYVSLTFDEHERKHRLSMNFETDSLAKLFYSRSSNSNTNRFTSRNIWKFTSWYYYHLHWNM